MSVRGIESVSQRAFVAPISVATAFAAFVGLATGLFVNAPLLAIASAGGLALLAAVVLVPASAPWTWLLLGPLIVGVARPNSAIPLRPNELLLLVGIAGLTIRGAWHSLRGERFLPRGNAIDLCVVLLVVTGSAMPLLLRFGRGLPVSHDDVLYALVFVKYALVYGMFRIAVRTPHQVRWALTLTLISGAIVAVIAILQVKGLFGVQQLLSAYYDSPFEGTTGAVADRGSSTIASSFGLADMMAMCLALTIALSASAESRRLWLAGAGLLFVGGAVAAGSFSGVIGLLVVALATAFVAQRLVKSLAIMGPAALASAALFWPVIAARLAGFDNLAGMPHSWVGRLNNLRRFFWPQIFDGFNWLWGVRPAARVPAPETWRTWVNIESGHTWLMWVGGMPLLLAFFLFSAVVATVALRVARTTTGPVGAAATAAFASVVMIFVLTIFDPHLTVRGCADLFFPLLALAVTIDQRSEPVSAAQRLITRGDFARARSQ